MLLILIYFFSSSLLGKYAHFYTEQLFFGNDEAAEFIGGLEKDKMLSWNCGQQRVIADSSYSYPEDEIIGLNCVELLWISTRAKLLAGYKKQSCANTYVEVKLV